MKSSLKKVLISSIFVQGVTPNSSEQKASKEILTREGHETNLEALSVCFAFYMRGFLWGNESSFLQLWILRYSIK